MKPGAVYLPESFERLPPEGAAKTPVRPVRQSKIALSSPASSPALCTPWTKIGQRPETDTTSLLLPQEPSSPRPSSSPSGHLNAASGAGSASFEIGLTCRAPGVLVMVQRYQSPEPCQIRMPDA